MKIDKRSVLYFAPEEIGSQEGAHCSICMMFLKDTSECTIVSPSKVNGARGVCEFYIHGDPTTTKEHEPMGVISKETAGYVENGPTHCANCEYYMEPGEVVSTCEKVEGIVAGKGCCNAWEELDDDDDENPSVLILLSRRATKK